MRNLDDGGSRTYGLRHVDFGLIKVQPTIKNHGVVIHTGRNGISVKVADIRGDEIVWHKYKLEALLDSFLEVKRLAVVHEEAAGEEEGFTMVVRQVSKSVIIAGRCKNNAFPYFFTSLLIAPNLYLHHIQRACHLP